MAKSLEHAKKMIYKKALECFNLKYEFLTEKITEFSCFFNYTGKLRIKKHSQAPNNLQANKKRVKNIESQFYL